MSVLDWLKEQLESYGDPFKCVIEWTELDELIEQAKEKELNQISEKLEVTEKSEFVDNFDPHEHLQKLKEDGYYSNKK